MDHLKELRIDIFLYFILALGHRFSVAVIIFFTTMFAMRLWYPDILAEIERDIVEDTRAPRYSEVEINDFKFEDANDIQQNEEKVD